MSLLFHLMLHSSVTDFVQHSLTILHERESLFCELSASTGTNSAAEAAKILAENRRLMREQREKEEQLRVQREEEEK